MPLHRSRGAVWTPQRRQIAWMSAGAAALVAASVMLTVIVMGGQRPGQLIATNPDTVRIASPLPTGLPVYDSTIKILTTAVSSRQSQLDTATIRIIKKNLTIIDAAIAESRAALAKDPKNKYLTQQLTRVLDQKVGLLRTAALLPAKT